MKILMVPMTMVQVVLDNLFTPQAWVRGAKDPLAPTPLAPDQEDKGEIFHMELISSTHFWLTAY